MRITSLRVTRVAGLLLVAAAAGCDVLATEHPLLELERHRDRWAREGPSSYRYAIRRACFCGGLAIGPARVTVEDGEVTARVYVENGAPVPAGVQDAFPSVDGLFDVIAGAYARDAHRVDVTYDPELGVPLEIDIDYEEFTNDEELGFKVVEDVVPIG